LKDDWRCTAGRRKLCTLWETGRKHCRRRCPAPVLAGFDSRVQSLHIHDAAVDGTFNIAAHPPLILSQAILLACGQPLPLPAFAFQAASFLAPIRSLIGALPFPVEYLNYTYVGNIRRAACEIHWAPQHQPDETLRAIATVTA